MTKIFTLIKRFLPVILFFTLLCVEAFAADGDEEDTCQSFSTYQSDGAGGNCVICGIFQIIADACGSIATTAWSTFSGPLQGVIAVGASIYIAIATLKLVGSFSKQDVMNYLSNSKNGVFVILFKAAVIILLLGNESFIYTNLLTPVIDVGFDIASGIGYDNSVASHVSGSGAASSLFNNVIAKIRDINNIIYGIVALGRLLICIAQLPDEYGPISWMWRLIPVGFVLCIYGWALLIGLSFYLLDVFFRLCVGCMVLPLAIACAFSKITSKYARSTFDLFINVMANFAMLGIVVRLTEELITKAVSYSKESPKESSEDAWQNIFTTESFSADDAKALALQISFLGFLLMVVCCLICFLLFMQMESLAEKVSSTKATGKTGAAVGGDVAKTTYKPVKGLAKAGRQTLGGYISHSKIGVGARKFGMNISSMPAKLEGMLFGTGRYSNRSIWR